MSLHVRACLALATILATGCDPASKEIGSTVGETGSMTTGETTGEPGGDDSGTSDGGVMEPCTPGQRLVSGTVEREMMPTNWNEPFVPTAEAHVVMRLSSFIYDGPSMTIVEHDVPFTAIPFDFEICGDPATVFDADGIYADGIYEVEVDVYNHEGLEIHVGDLLDEYLNEIEGPTEGLVLRVSGVEHCDSPGAGGLCTGNG